MGTLHKALSYRQKQAIEIWVTGGRKSKAQALRQAGFSEAIARVPSKVFDSPAVQQELELRGLGEDGLSNGELPHAEITEVVTDAPHCFDPSTLSKEQCQEIKALLSEVEGKDPFVREWAETPWQPFRNDTSNSTPFQDTEYSRMSSM